jgi:hypothetical protein
MIERRMARVELERRVGLCSSHHCLPLHKEQNACYQILDGLVGVDNQGLWRQVSVPDAFLVKGCLVLRPL